MYSTCTNDNCKTIIFPLHTENSYYIGSVLIRVVPSGLQFAYVVSNEALSFFYSFVLVVYSFVDVLDRFRKYLASVLLTHTTTDKNVYHGEICFDFI